MSLVFPIPTVRSSQVLVTTRLQSQLQFNQLELFRIQNQISTGRRITAPSEDAPAALRAMVLQRLLEQKDQIKVNISTTNSFLNASDSALSGVANLLAEIRGAALTAANTTSDDIQRQAVALEVSSANRQLADIGNQRFRGRYLFAGTKVSVEPFEMVDQFIVYHGNDGKLRSFVDIDLLLQTNVSGEQVFGAVSPEVRGTVDLDPILTLQTRLADLRSGLGIADGSILVSDGTTSSTIDLSAAETIGNVVDLIEANPPPGRTITARITDDALVIDIADGGGNLTIREVGGGVTATELKIFDPIGVGTGSIVSGDLNPILRLTTRLSDILGVRASAILQSAGNDNDLVLEATTSGTTSNGVAIQFVDDSLLQAAPGLGAGSETVTFSSTALAARASLTLSGTDNDLILTAVTPGASMNDVAIVLDSSANLGNNVTATFTTPGGVATLTLGIDDTNETTLGALTTAINGSGLFTASADGSAGEGFNPAGFVQSTDAAVVTGNTGNSGGDPSTIFINIDVGRMTANDVIAAVQADPTVSAMFDVRLDGKDTTLDITAGTGLIDINATAITSGGAGTELDLSSGLQIVNGGETFTIDFTGAETIEDMLNILNGSDANVLGQIDSDARGIDVRSRLSGSNFHIGENGGTMATALGIRSFTRETLLADLNHGFGVHVAEGTDFTIRRNDSVDLAIDISAARTIGDVLDLINNPPDNLDPLTAVVAQLTSVGNGIELVDDNPSGGEMLTLTRAFQSFAVWDLGLIPKGVDVRNPGDLPPPAPATATVVFTPPNDINNGIVFTASQSGTALNGVQINIVNAAAVGDQALVAFDSIANTLTIDVGPTATTANTVMAAVDAEGTFSTAVDQTLDPTNDGTGLIVDVGTVGVTSGGTPNPASQSTTATVTLPPPDDLNTAMVFTAAQLGSAMNGVDIVFANTLLGDVATAVFNPIANQLVIDIDPAQTTANTIVAVVSAEGTFSAALDTVSDPTNNGTGVVNAVAIVATTARGTAKMIIGIDTNPLEAKGVFNSLIRLEAALLDGDIVQIRRAINLLDDDLTRVSFARAELGARGQGLDIVKQRVEDEEIELKRTLSAEIDVDLTEAISNFTARQAALQASMQAIAFTFQTTLLDYL